MSDNPITKQIKRHVSGYWPGYPGMNAAHGPTWTVGLLQKIVDDCRAAGYDDRTELTAEIGRDPSGLRAFRLSLAEAIADEIPVSP